MKFAGQPPPDRGAHAAHAEEACPPRCAGRVFSLRWPVGGGRDGQPQPHQSHGGRRGWRQEIPVDDELQLRPQPSGQRPQGACSGLSVCWGWEAARYPSSACPCVCHHVVDVFVAVSDTNPGEDTPTFPEPSEKAFHEGVKCCEVFDQEGALAGSMREVCGGSAFVRPGSIHRSSVSLLRILCVLLLLGWRGC